MTDGEQPLGDEEFVRVYDLRDEDGESKTILTTIDNVYLNDDRNALVQWKRDKGTNVVMEGYVDSTLHSIGVKVLEARIIPSHGCVALEQGYVPPYSTVFGVHVFSRSEYDGIVTNLESDGERYERKKQTILRNMNEEITLIKDKYDPQLKALDQPVSIEVKVAEYLRDKSLREATSP